MTYLEFNRKERVRLEHIISAAPDARQVRRAQAFIWLDAGEPGSESAQRLGVSRQSVYNGALRVQPRDDIERPARRAEAPRRGRPCPAKGSLAALGEEVLDPEPRPLG